MPDPTRQSAIKRALIPTLVLLVGLVAAYLLLRSAPETAPEEKQQAPRIVQVLAVKPETRDIHVTAYGTVVPARQLTIQPQVSGSVVHQHEALVPGGRIGAGETLVMIDPSDYQLRLDEMKAALEEAEFEFDVEQGRQVVASREWSLLEKDLDAAQVNRELVLRKPHLERAEAAIDKANNAIAKAALDLTRTSIAAPFDAVVISESTEVGQLLGVGDTIATLAGTAEFWVQVTLPVTDLEHLKFPGPGESGPRATITLDAGGNSAGAGGEGDDLSGGSAGAIAWEGELIRLLGDLDPQGRMARALVRVEEPLGGSQVAPLLLGSFVRVDIEAGSIKNVTAIPRTALRDGERLWAVGSDNRLVIRDTRLLWVDGETLLVDYTLEPGERIITSSLRAALPGMHVDPQSASPGDEIGQVSSPL